VKEIPKNKTYKSFILIINKKILQSTVLANSSLLALSRIVLVCNMGHRLTKGPLGQHISKLIFLYFSKVLGLSKMVSVCMTRHLFYHKSLFKHTPV